MTEVGRVSVTEEEGKKRFTAIGVAVMIVCGVRREREWGALIFKPSLATQGQVRTPFLPSRTHNDRALDSQSHARKNTSPRQRRLYVPDSMLTALTVGLGSTNTCASNVDTKP